MNTSHEIAHKELYGIKTILNGGGHGTSYDIGSKKHIDQFNMYLYKNEIPMFEDEFSELYKATKKIYDKRVELVSLLKQQNVNINQINDLNNLINQLVESYKKRNNYFPC